MDGVKQILLREWRKRDPFLRDHEGFVSFVQERLHSPIQAGDIVVQTWSWIGIYDRIIPYWQVRLVKEAELYHGIMSEKEAKRRFGVNYRREGQGVYTPNPEGGYDYYCHAVPYTAWPMEIRWFHISADEAKPDVRKTGLVWSVPTWKEHGSWYELCHEEIELPSHWSTNRRQIVSDIVVSLRRPRNDGRPCCPLVAEKELVDILDALPVKYWEWTRENFEENMATLRKWLAPFMCTTS